LSEILNNHGTLNFELRVDAQPTASVMARIGCGHSCQGEIAIDTQLKTMTPGEWQKLSIDLQCFAIAGTDFDRVNSPFIVSTEGSLRLSFANITLQTNNANNANIRCSDKVATNPINGISEPGVAM
jgi:beta-glucosidase